MTESNSEQRVSEVNSLNSAVAVFGDAVIHPLDEDFAITNYFILIRSVDDAKRAQYYVRTKQNWDPFQLLGVLDVQVKLLVDELHAEWEPEQLEPIRTKLLKEMSPSPLSLVIKRLRKFQQRKRLIARLLSFKELVQMEKTCGLFAPQNLGIAKSF